MKNIFKRFFMYVLCAAFIFTPCANAFLLTVNGAGAEPLKKRATYYTDEKLANMKENVEKYPWARSTVASVTAKADTYLKDYSLEELWALIPSQKVFRSYGVNQTYGCLNCGNAIDAYGNYPYTHNHTSDPWKVTCPNCKMRFPTNDFGAYYESGLNEKGEFVPSKADKSLLVNTLYPEKGEKWGVDDGTSYVHTTGQKYFFVAYYCHWELWYSSGIITQAINAFANAYVYTGEQKYADAGIVMLNRIGDLYPSFNIDECPWSEGYRHSGVSKGKIIGSIWETGLVRNFIFAYDAFFRGFSTMGSEALNLLKAKSSKIQSYKDVMVNIEDGLIKTIYPTVKQGNIRGNNGMHQYTLSAAAVVLDDKSLSAEWMDYVFRAGTTGTGGNVAATFVDDVDRDGWGNEAAPGYNSGWLSNYIGMANLLRGYVINGTDLSYDLYENIKFKKMFASAVEIMATPKFAPNIGDSGSTGSGGVVASNTYIIEAYLKYNEPVYAQMIYFLAKGNVDNIRLGIFDKDPESLPEKIKAVIAEHGEYSLESRMLTGYGLATCMNINAATEISENDSKFSEFVGDDFSVINAKSLTNAVRNNGVVTFTPEKANDSFSIGFNLNNTESVYELIVYSSGIANAGKYNVFVDGKLLQDAVDFDTKQGERTSVYFRRTASYVPGYHIITFQASEKKVGPIAIEGVRLIKTANTSSSEFHNERTTMTMYFGRNTGHGHYDTLNLEIFAFDINMTPDLGYPEFCDGTPNQVHWVSNALSHNTVFINDSHMGSQIVSQPKAFDSSELVSLVSVDASNVYTMADKYQRTSALIKYDNEYSYIVDFFAVEGGKKHTYSFHPAESGGVVTTGLNLVKQADDKGNYIGTLLGPTVEWGAANSSTGYQYLDKVQKDNNPESTISFDWSITETNYTTASDIHLKLTMLNELDNVVLANGTPPRNKAGNPKGLDYVLATREASKNLSSLFVSVIEPYIADSYILSSEIVPVTTDKGVVNDDSVKALKITFKNGRTDYVVYSENGDATYTIDKKFYFKGFFGVCSIRDDEIVTYTNDAVMDLTEKQTSYTGVVQGFTKELEKENFITVKFDTEIDESKLAGNYIYIENDGVRNASYRIIGAKKEGENYVLDIGDVTPIRSYINTTDLKGGYIYDVAVNRRFYIRLTETAGNLEKLTANVKSYISDVILSNNIKKDAVIGDRVARMLVIRKGINSLYQLPEYEITLNSDLEDSAMFEIKDGWLYLSDKYVAGKSDYTVSLNISNPETGESKSVLKSLTTLGASQSKAQLYPDFDLTETADTAEFKFEDMDTDISAGEDDRTPSPVNWLLVAITGVICAAVVALTALFTKKKKA